MLEVKDLSVKYSNTDIIENISFDVEKNTWLMILGPNGAGKSTIVKALSRSVNYAGEIFLDNKNIKHFKPKEYAKQIGFLMQSHNVGYSFTVNEIVKLGRYSYSSGLLMTADENLIDKALELTGMKSLKNRSVLTLSGGELQRTFLAQLFAQDPNILVLDEPTNNLDFVYQKQIFDIIKNWLKSPGKSVISVVHDLNLAKSYGTHGLLINNGKTEASGDISSVLSKENLNRVYKMDVQSWMKDMLLQW